MLSFKRTRDYNKESFFFYIPHHVVARQLSLCISKHHKHSQLATNLLLRRVLSLGDWPHHLSTSAIFKNQLFMNKKVKNHYSIRHGFQAIHLQMPQCSVMVSGQHRNLPILQNCCYLDQFGDSPSQEMVHWYYYNFQPSTSVNQAKMFLLKNQNYPFIEKRRAV